MVVFLPGTLFLAIELSVLLLPPYCFGHLLGIDIMIIVVEVVADGDREGRQDSNDAQKEAEQGNAQHCWRTSSDQHF